VLLERIWRILGPGILLAATSIGASHLVLSPQAGARFGYQLLWLVLAAHLFKYPAFECGPRYAAATGQHLLQGYLRLGGPRGWALWLFLASTVAQGIGVLAGVVSVSGAVLSSWTGWLDSTCWSLLVITVVVFLLLAGGFGWLDSLNKVMMATLAVSTLLAFLPVCPGPGKLAHLVMPALPEGSILLVAAILGWMPTGIDVSIWHSFWSLEKIRLLEARGRAHGRHDPATRLRAALIDMRTGYGLSLLTGIMFVCMGASYLAGRAGELRGVEFANALSSAYTSVMGEWMRQLFMLTAFFAMFSTSYTVIDGFSRSFSEALATLVVRFSGPRPRRRHYLAFVAGSSILAAVTIRFAGNPVTLVTVVALLSLAVAPLLYALNLLCTDRHIEEAALRPHRFTLWLGWAGVVVMLLALGLTFHLKVLAG